MKQMFLDGVNETIKEELLSADIDDVFYFDEIIEWVKKREIPPEDIYEDIILRDWADKFYFE